MQSKKVVVFLLFGALTGCALQPDSPPVPTPQTSSAPPLPTLAMVNPSTGANPNVSASVTLPSPALAPQIPEDVIAATQILSEVSKALSGGGDSLRREIAAANAGWARTRTDATRLKLALMVIVGSAGAADDGRALSLLEPFLTRGAEQTMFKTVAEIVALPLLERGRMVREEQKKAEAARVLADATKKELDVVQQKLDALRQLERSLTRRNGK